LPDKVEYIIEEAETKGEHPADAPSPFGYKQAMGIDDKKDIVK